MSQYAEINYLNTPKGLSSWLFTLDHKRIGLMYLAAIIGFLALGGLIAIFVAHPAAINTATKHKEKYSCSCILSFKYFLFFICLPFAFYSATFII